MLKLKNIITAGTLASLLTVSYAEETLKFNGQIRTRSTVNKTEGVDDPTYKHELRSRFGATATPSEKVTMKLELQDSRNYGSTPPPLGAVHTATIGNKQNIDLLQGYVTVKEGDLALSLGRQKLKYGSQRIISSLEWHPNARVFDGLTANYKGFDFVLLSAADLATTPEQDIFLTGGFYKGKITETMMYDASVVYDRNTTLNWDLFYYGAHVNGSAGMFFYDLEGIYQGGEKGDATSAAYYTAAKAGVKVNKMKFSIGYDIMSGDDPETEEFEQYRNSYTFAHAYFGWADKFIVNPGTGVNDLRFDAIVPVTEKATLKAMYHYFTPNQDTSFDTYGSEIDMEVHLNLFPKSKIVIGANIWMGDEDGPMAADGLNVYFMPIFNF